MSAKAEGLAEEHDRARRDRMVDQALLLGLVNDRCYGIAVEAITADGCFTQPLPDLFGEVPIVIGSELGVVNRRHQLEE